MLVQEKSRGYSGNKGLESLDKVGIYLYMLHGKRQFLLQQRPTNRRGLDDHQSGSGSTRTEHLDLAESGTGYRSNRVGNLWGLMVDSARYCAEYLPVLVLVRPTSTRKGSSIKMVLTR
jgi:hypothetical protein